MRTNMLILCRQSLFIGLVSCADIIGVVVQRTQKGVKAKHVRESGEVR